MLACVRGWVYASVMSLGIVGACERATAPVNPAPPEVPAARPDEEPQELDRVDVPATDAAIERTPDGRCDPLPKEGAACGDGDSWCVVSWGEPGGFSSALWCRDGKWVREEEVNLPD